MKRRTKVLGAVAALLIVAQGIPYPPAQNPPVTEEVEAPEAVRVLLRKSCYDCHSNETVWPWYSRVIPAKWFVRHHVMEGREQLNFSTWAGYSEERADRKLEEVMEYVEEGWMPMQSYLRLHPEARLTSEEKDRIVAWAESLMGTSAR
jgi:hypothetical protein